jgi:hypothetical protein
MRPVLNIPHKKLLPARSERWKSTEKEDEKSSEPL